MEVSREVEECERRLKRAPARLNLPCEVTFDDQVDNHKGISVLRLADYMPPP